MRRNDLLKASYENILRDVCFEVGNPRETLCQLRWNQPTVDLSKGQVRVCCRVPSYTVTETDLKNDGAGAITNNKYLLERRLEMFQGTRHKDCASCWKAEKSHQPSPREGANEIFKRLKSLDSELASTEAFGAMAPNHKILQADSAFFLEIQVGNLCDLKCVYCWRGNSSKWAQEDLKFQRISQAELDHLNRPAAAGFQGEFWKWVDAASKDLKMISFVGGEPTMYPDLPDLLFRAHHSLLVKNNSACRLRLVTNLNCQKKLFERLLDMAADLDRENRTLLIDISMESFGRRAEIIRYGLDWKTFEQNLIALCDKNFKNVQIAFSATVNLLSVSSFSQFIEFLAPLRRQFKIPFPFLENSVVDPIWLATEILTPDFQGYFIDAAQSLRRFEAEADFRRSNPIWGYNWSRYAQYIEQLGDGLTHSAHTMDTKIEWTRGRLAKGLEDLELRRNIKFANEFPEMIDFFALCQGIRRRLEL